MQNEFKDKVILVTGGTGSIGSELVRQLLEYEPKQIRVLSRNETKQYTLLEKLNYPKNLRMLIGDVRDKERLILAFEGVDIVFHSAALKHVPFCEYNPSEAVKTNVVGSQNVIEAALHNNVQKVIGISTDKAASPQNVLGISKLLMEKLFITYNSIFGHKTKFSCVRFGNVAWADGSVLPLWKKQVEASGVINITDRRMTRFLMSTQQAVNLVVKASILSKGGEIFVLKMSSIKLPDMAKIFLSKYYPGQKIKVKNVGKRSGEKIHEEICGINDEGGEIWGNGEMVIIRPPVHIYNLERVKVNYPGFKPLSSVKSFSSEKLINSRKVGEII